MDPNDPRLVAFIDVPRTSDFPIQNLPFGMFTTHDDRSPRAGVAIGSYVLDLRAVASAGALELGARERTVFEEPSLCAFFALGQAAWRRVRASVSTLLRIDNPRLRDERALRSRALVPMADVTLQMPVEPTGFTDFYSSREHATNVGTMFRDPQNALLPNWLEMPVAYNGRPSSVVVSGTPVRRPQGQTRRSGAPRPIFGPTQKLDFELETAFVVGTGNALGESIAVDTAEEHIFGLVLLNDWSARDLQQWEYQPLGPFNSKSFASSISPWIVTLDALEPFRTPGPPQDPAPLAYLRERQRRGFDIALDVSLRPKGGSTGSVIARTNMRTLYWTVAQQLAHHTISGCNARPSDLMGSGTISGADRSSLGSLLELTQNALAPLVLAAGDRRTFLEDGDEVTITGSCTARDYRMGFGEVRGTILPARS